MTGYGKSVVELENKKLTIEIKSLNSKQLDIYTRIPGLYKEKELELRNSIKSRLERGKIELNIFIESIGLDKTNKINKPVIEAYYNQLKEISNSLDIELNASAVESLLKLPDALKVEIQELDESEWLKIEQTFQSAIDAMLEFRKQEGDALEKDILQRINKIEELLLKVEPFEEKRIEYIKKRISDGLNEFIENQKVDQNRFEQEIIYYIEKIDITEEKVRLKNHCDYFRKTCQTQESVGKKLGFISQEIGREINTLGSKANDSDIQKIVIQMKDELEKVKEQILNVL